MICSCLASFPDLKWAVVITVLLTAEAGSQWEGQGSETVIVMTSNICWQSCSIAFCTLLSSQNCFCSPTRAKENTDFYLVALLKVVFMRSKCWCLILRDGWIVFLCLLSSAVVPSGFWWKTWVLNAHSGLKEAQEGAWDCGMNEGWVQACLHVLSHLPLKHNWNSPHKLV